MSAFFHVLQVLLAIGLIALVLLQHGKGADAGAAFGSGSSATVFGSQGSGNFLSRATAILAALFFINSLILAYFSAQVSEPESVITSLPAKEESAPAPITDMPTFPMDDLQQSLPAQTQELPAGSAEAPAPAANNNTEAPAASSDVPVVPAESTPAEERKQE